MSEPTLDEMMGWLSELAERGYRNEKPLAEAVRDRMALVDAPTPLLLALLHNDPNDMAADGVTVLDVWRKEARALLSKLEG